MTSKFHFLVGDVNFLDYGGKWYRKLTDTRYHIIELINMWDVTGEDNQDKYNVSLVEIDLEIISEREVKSAWESCGWGSATPSDILQVIESISSYGLYAPLGDWSSHNAYKLFKQAKQESYALDNQSYHDKQLNRPVNRLGSTAIEYAKGDFKSAILRGIFNNDPSAKIIGKVNGLTQDDINTLQSLDKTEQEITLQTIKNMHE